MKSRRAIALFSVLIIILGITLIIWNQANKKTAVSDRLPIGVNVSPGFRPESASFVTSNLGYVLGTSTCKTGSCLTIARTTDGGLTWKSISAPVTSIMNSIPAAPSSISRIFFISPLEGYLFDPGLFVTLDGGKTWKNLNVTKLFTGYVTSMQATAANVYVAASASDTIGGGSGRLFAAKRGSTSFTVQNTLKIQLSNYPIISANSLGVVISPLDSKGRVFYAVNGSSSWKSIAVNCSTEFPNDPIVSIAAPVQGAQVPQLIALCASNPGAGSEQKKILISENLSTFVPTNSSPGLGGIAQSIASPDGKTIAVAASSGATFLYTTRDSGKNWKIGLEDATLGGASIHDLDFVSTSQAFAMIGDISGTVGISSKLIVTKNYGASWQEMKIS
jgi:photosystem II stability/assembly factor-like uncharacterized protein